MTDSQKYANRPERRCVKCGVLFSGYRCKTCQSKYKKDYIDANRNHINETNRAWRKANPEKQKKSVYNWKINNIEKAREINRRSILKRKDRRIIESAEWRKQNPEKVKKSWQEWSKKNTDRLKEKRRKYEELFPDRVRARKHTRRTRILNIDSKINPDYINVLKIAQDMKCNYCNQLMINYQIDHIVPIARGGDNSNQNLQLLCASCNRQKGAKTDKEYREYLNVINS